MTALMFCMAVAYVRSSPFARPGITETSKAKKSPAISPIVTAAAPRSSPVSLSADARTGPAADAPVWWDTSM
ncbi:hypothetical protein GCM10010394_24130 [Streptomyces crystallinus]|uniref:Secreted protein n=1 Tax=Streptomyces crystallinus TaxID=68191 RepID=A0ABP3QQV9_9ACTN